MRAVVFRRKEAFKESWARGDFTHLEHIATALLNAKAIGACDTLQEVLEIDYPVILGELSDERSIGNEPEVDDEDD